MEKVIRRDPVAIIGMSCRFPGGNEKPGGVNIHEFWDLLINKTDAIRDVPKDRWNPEFLYHPDSQIKGRIHVRQGGFIDGWDKFDASFFGISPKDALHMDPQQRILLENSYHMLEDAGLKLEDISNSRTGVYIGISSHDYGEIQLSPTERIHLDAHSIQGSSNCIASNRISYIFNLKGPSISIDTACSSSLVAIHYACRSIWSKEIDMAFVGSVNAIFKPEIEMAFCKGGFLADDCRCKAFDSSADGYVRSEGAGTILLKPYSRALADGNPVYALIIGTAVNQDGKTSGITMPNISSQQSVLEEAYKDARLNPEYIGYVEAHGTGTAVGDPIEAEALGKALGKCRRNDDPLWIGSVKSNIGHLEPASGMAGIIKTVLMIKNNRILPNIHFKNPNPKIKFKEWHIDVPTDNFEFPKINNNAYAGINSFGFGGTNAHIVLQSVPVCKSKKINISSSKNEKKVPFIFTLSASEVESLKMLAQKHILNLSNTVHNLRDICFTLARKRTCYDYRLSIAAHTKEDVIENLTAYTRQEEKSHLVVQKVRLNRPAKIAFVYSGQGSQWWGMGQELLQTEPVFFNMIKKIDKILSNWGWLKESKSSLIKELSKDEKNSLVHKSGIVQLTLFSIQVALTEVWRKYGIKPHAVIGHSLGEAAAAWACGALSLEEATRIIYAKSLTQARLSGLGKMMSIGLSEKEANQAIQGYNGKITLAAINGPGLVTVSGEEDSLMKLSEVLEKKDIFNRILVVDIPYHSNQMEIIRDEFINLLGKVKTQEKVIPFFSSVIKKAVDKEPLDVHYWYANMRELVSFYPLIKKMIKEGYNTFIEISPHPILANHIDATFNEMKYTGISLPSLRRMEPEMLRIFTSIGALFCNGFNVCWEHIFNGTEKQVQLPLYEWHKEQYWLETEVSKGIRSGAYYHPHLEEMKSSSEGNRLHIWKVNLDSRIHDYIADHRVQGPIVYPGAGHCELAISAAIGTYGEKFNFIENINFVNPLFLPEEGEPPQIQLEISSVEGNYTIVTGNNTPHPVWHVLSNGRINYFNDKFQSEKQDLSEIRNRITKPVAAGNVTLELTAGGMEFGDTFKGIRKLWHNDSEAIAQIHVHDRLKPDFDQFNIHPAILDNCFQAAFGILIDDFIKNIGVYLPIHIDRFKFYAKPKTHIIWSYARKRDISDKDYTSSDIWIFDDENNLVAEIQGFIGKYLKGSRGEVDEDFNNWFYEYEWIPRKKQDIQIMNLNTGFKDTEMMKEKVIKKTSWIIFADQKGISSRLALHLKNSGKTCFIVHEKQSMQFSGTNHNYSINPRNSIDFQNILNDISGNELPLEGIIYLWGLNTPDINTITGEKIETEISSIGIKLLNLFKTLVSRNFTNPPRVWIVTNGVEKVIESDKNFSIFLSQLWGITRVFINENPQFKTTILDLSYAINDDEIDSFCHEIMRKGTDVREEEIAFRGRQCFVHKLQQVNTKVEYEINQKYITAAGYPCKLKLQNHGSFDDIILKEFKPALSMANDEIKISVHSASLNSRDVMLTEGHLSEEKISSGFFENEIVIDCAGTIIETGKSVNELKTGDDVMVCAKGSITGLLTVGQAYAVKKPSFLKFEEAATIPFVYLTAYYALHYLARITCRDRILVHSVAGGVGIAAIRLALLSQAEVYATCDDNEKKKYLRELGVKYIFNTHTLSFKDELLTATNGKGVDIVFNSFTGDVLVQSLKCLAPSGRFIDISKTDNYSNISVDLKSFGNNLSYFVVDINTLLKHNPELCNKLLKEVTQLFENNKIIPNSYRDYPVSHSAEALKFFMQSGHIGKVIVSMTGAKTKVVPDDTISFKRNATYLIAGGTSGFGLAITSWMASREADSLVLVSRNGINNKEDQQKINDLRMKGITVSIIKADISDFQQVNDVIKHIATTLPPLKGIINSAMILEDAFIISMDDDKYENVIRPKIIGTLNLHHATVHLDLDYFIMFSSMASLWGNPGQSNYAAANSFLDTFAYYRRSCGLAANTINWGVLGDSGFVSRTEKVKNNLMNQGLKAFTSEQALTLFEKLLIRNSIQRGTLCVDWGKMEKEFPHTSNSFRFKHLYNRNTPFQEKIEKQDTYLSIANAPNEEVKIQLLSNFCKDTIAGILGTSREKVKYDINLNKVGLDSLMASQLRTSIHKKLNIDYSIMRIMQGISINELVLHLLKELENG